MCLICKVETSCFRVNFRGPVCESVVSGVVFSGEDATFSDGGGRRDEETLTEERNFRIRPQRNSVLLWRRCRPRLTGTRF